MPRPFRFKQFDVSDDRCSMKVGTDAVLLGAWVDVTGVHRVLDIGTGSGVIALMLAQRTADDVHIDGVEIAAADAAQARENVAASPWPSRVLIHQTSIQEFNPQRKYDLVVTNPPFFHRSLLPPSPGRATARHTHGLDHDELLAQMARLLAPGGRFAVVLPTIEGGAFTALATSRGYHRVRSIAFYTRASKPQERWLFEFAAIPQPEHSETLLLYDGNNKWTEEYRLLTAAFYLDSASGAA